MESLIVSLNAVAPMFFMMLLGYFLKGIHFFTDGALKQMNALVFKVLLPLQLFRSAYQADLREVMDAPFLLWNEGLVLLSFILLALVAVRTVREPGKRASLLQGMFRGNIALVGMAIAETLFGEGETGTMAILVAITVPVYNVLAVLALAAGGFYLLFGGKDDPGTAGDSQAGQQGGDAQHHHHIEQRHKHPQAPAAPAAGGRLTRSLWRER